MLTGIIYSEPARYANQQTKGDVVFGPRRFRQVPVGLGETRVVEKVRKLETAPDVQTLTALLSGA
jgi:hypothetical protein